MGAEPNNPLQPECIAARYGEIRVFKSNDLISNSLRNYGEWAQNEIDILCRFIAPGNIVVDAGAYIGTHSLAFAHAVGNTGHVHAFEPAPSSHARLKANAEAFEHRNISTYNIGLGKEPATLSLDMEAELDNLASASMMKIRNKDVVEVSIQDFDSFNYSRLDFLKVDVEGMELQLLEGADHSLAKHRPIIFLEVNTLTSSHKFLGWAQDHGYKVYGINVPAYNPENFFGCDKNIFGNAREVGALLFPLEKIGKHQEVIDKLAIPCLSDVDELVALLLHKPQYIQDVLAHTDVANCLGTAYATHERSEVAELKTLLADYTHALEDAGLAYSQLRLSYDEKLQELQDNQDLLQQASASLNAMHQDASAAYEALRLAYEAKVEELAAIKDREPGTPPSE